MVLLLYNVSSPPYEFRVYWCQVVKLILLSRWVAHSTPASSKQTRDTYINTSTCDTLHTKYANTSKMSMLMLSKVIASITFSCSSYIKLAGNVVLNHS